MIEESKLSAYGAKEIYAKKGVYLFLEGDTALYYYQIISGEVKMVNHSPEGKEFVQGIFRKGQSFGEPPLFSNARYPASAFATDDARLFKLSRDKFLDLLKDNFDIHLKFTTTLAQRMMYKAMMLKEISSYEPEHRILTFIDYLKEQQGSPDTPYEVKLTRKQLGNLLGIRVETVIRTVKGLEKKGLLKIQNRKVYR